MQSFKNHELEQFLQVNQQKDGYARVFVLEFERLGEHNKAQAFEQFKNRYRLYNTFDDYTDDIDF